MEGFINNQKNFEGSVFCNGQGASVMMQEWEWSHFFDFVNNQVAAFLE